MEYVQGENLKDKLESGPLSLKDALEMATEIAEALWAIEQEIRRSSMINPLLGFFAVSYEYAYPDCMDANPVVFKKTTQFETVVKNGWGAELYRYPTGSFTQNNNINQRHAEAFRKLEGETSGPESVGVLCTTRP